MFFWLVVFTCCLVCSDLNAQVSLKFLDEYKIPFSESFQDTHVGGLSGIDYNPINDEYYLISDDRSARNPARFYTAKIRFSGHEIDSLWFTSVTCLRNSSQGFFPPYADDSLHSCDPEGIRFNPIRNELTWCSEGERFLRKGAAYLRDPWIYNMSVSGQFKDSFRLPQNMHVGFVEKGPRRNSSFEGLSFSLDYENLFVSLEEPIFEDGPRAALKDTGAWTRIVRFNARTKLPDSQFAYRLDPVGAIPSPQNGFKINGISDILVLNNEKMLVIERSYSTGVRQNTIKVYLASRTEATDVSANQSLMDGNFQPLSKRLLLNMDSLGIHIDNIEGVCLGPKLPGGGQTVLFISDNNFNKDQVTQLLFFQIEY